MIPEGSVLDTVAHVVAAVLLLGGSFMAMVAGIGIARFPDLLSRMHAATKPQVLGLALLMTGLALEIRTSYVIWTLALVVIFQLITAPVSAHMVGRAGYRTSQVRSDLLVVDELTEDLDLVARATSAEAAAAPGAAPGAPPQRDATAEHEDAAVLITKEAAPQEPGESGQGRS